MSEEIKKIKDKLEIIIRNDFDYLLRTHDCKILLDYITNLQQKVERLEKENKRLKEENKHIFQNVNDDELLISNAMNYAELKKTEKRVEQLENIKKEIKEYIEKNVVCFKNGDMLVELNVDDLLNILNKGSDKE